MDRIRLSVFFFLAVALHTGSAQAGLPAGVSVQPPDSGIPLALINVAGGVLLLGLGYLFWRVRRAKTAPPRTPESPPTGQMNEPPSP